jgi:hypothetical protein
VDGLCGSIHEDFRLRDAPEWRLGGDQSENLYILLKLVSGRNVAQNRLKRCRQST